MSILHLCLDIQKGYPARSPLYASWWGDLKQEVGLLATALEIYQIPTIYLAFGGGVRLENFREGVGFLQDTPQATKRRLEEDPGLAFDLALPATALVGYKNYGSAYAEPSLRAYVERGGYSTLILSGVFEASNLCNGCVTDTAIDFGEAGYKVVIAAEATRGGTPSAPSLEERKLFHQDLIGVDVMPRADILNQIANGSFLEPRRNYSRRGCGRTPQP